MESTLNKNVSNYSAERIKFQVRALVLLSSLSLAIVFAASFYFALLSNSTAIAKQVPELADVSNRMKGLLTTNIIVFAIVITVSFYLLSRIITSRMFKELDDFNEVLRSLASNRLAERDAIKPRGSFEELGISLSNAIGSLRDKEIKELELLRKMKEKGKESTAENAELEEIIENKRKFLGISSNDSKKEKHLGS